jgi:hypothetical protein
MRISVLIPSRGRPLGLALAIVALDQMASGENDIRYVIGCDADDEATITVSLDLWKCGLPIVHHIAGRQPSLGGLVNRLALKCPADVYCSLGDDVRVQTAGWDAVIAKAWQADPAGVWWWCSQNDATYAIVSEKWRAAAGHIFTDHFPFWYDDLWLIELQRYVTGKRGDRLDIWLQDRARGTHRMRDLAIWDKFFWSRREERRADARTIAERLGLPPIESFDGLDLGMSRTFDPNALEAKEGDRSPPTPEYLAALTRAKTIMEQVHG